MLEPKVSERLRNYTHDAFKGLAEHLLATPHDLARYNGTVMFGDVCWTFIPNDRAPDGSGIGALEGLRTLREALGKLWFG